MTEYSTSMRLGQKSIWVDGEGQKIKIASMTLNHAENVCHWLRDNAVTLLMRVELEESGDNESISTKRMLTILAYPHEEIRKTNVYRAITKRIAQLQ